MRNAERFYTQTHNIYTKSHKRQHYNILPPLKRERNEEKAVSLAFTHPKRKKRASKNQEKRERKTSKQTNKKNKKN